MYEDPYPPNYAVGYLLSSVTHSAILEEKKAVEPEGPMQDPKNVQGREKKLLPNQKCLMGDKSFLAGGFLHTWISAIGVTKQLCGEWFCAGLQLER